MTEESLSRPATLDATPEVDAFLRAENCSRDNPVAFDWLVGLARSLERKAARSEIAEYVAWCRYVQGPSATTIVLCDSDSPGAFKVYRSAVSARACKSVPVELWDDIVDFVTDHVDVRDGEDGVPQANAAMYLSSRIDQEVK